MLLVGLWLVWPLTISYAGGGADDALFVRLANSILDGDWLGPFDAYTLTKGPLYPLFLAATARLHVPILVATQAVLLLAGLLAARIAGRLLASRPAATAAFALLVVNPAPFDRVESLLLREPLYGGLVLLVLSLAARTWLLSPTRPLGSAVLLGLATAACWLTREEGFLLIPPLLLMAGWRTVHDLADVRLRRRFASGTVPLLAVPAVILAVPLLTVATLNETHYGVFRITDTTATPLMSAYGALSRIRHQWRPTVPIPHEAFLAAYEASPAARELRPDLEGEGRRFWTQASCRDQPIPGCNDIEAGWIMWALRGAATAAGRYRSAREADRYYRTLGREIDTACDAGRLACTARHDALLPPLRAAYLPLVVRDTWQVAFDVARLGPVEPGRIATLVPPNSYPPYRRIAPNTPQSPPFAAGQSRRLDLPPGHRRIAVLLTDLTPVLSAAGLPLALAWTVFRAASDLRRCRLDAATVFLLAIAGALLLRILFLGIMQATLVPMQFRYLSPAFPLVLLLVAASGADAFAQRRKALASCRALWTSRQASGLDRLQ